MHDEDPDWGAKCPHCGANGPSDTHKYLEDEWICFVCVGVWKDNGSHPAR